MSFDIFQARRDTEFWREAADAPLAAPGSYDLSKVPFASKKISGTVPFSSMSDRFSGKRNTFQGQGTDSLLLRQQAFGVVKGIDNRGRSQQQSDRCTYQIKEGVIEPLPGLLENKKQHKQNTKKTSHTPGFISQLARLAPSSAVLSAVELLPSSYHNPGPGTYKPPDEWSKKNQFEQLRCFLQDEAKKRKEGRQEILAKMNAKRPYNKPSIPHKKKALQGFSGVSCDNPGPQGYDPNPDFVKSKSSSALFSRSTSVREAFKIMRSSTGPLHYQPAKEPSPKSNVKITKSAIFSSKVPNCQDFSFKSDTPGPGHYAQGQPVERIKPNTGGTICKNNRAVFSANRLRGKASAPKEGFQRRSMESPFIDIKKQSQLPGPGGYFNPSPKDKILKRIASQQQSKSKFGQKPPFNSSLNRDCNQPLKKEEGVRPSHCLNPDNEANPPLSKTLLHLNSDRQLTKTLKAKEKPFGSSTDRFKSSYLNNVKQAKQNNPSEDVTVVLGLPKQFTVSRLDGELKEEKAQRLLKLKEQKSNQSSFQFKSRSKRLVFQGQQNPFVQDHTINEENQSSPPLIQFDAPDNNGSKTQRSITQKKANLYFDSSQERFGIQQLIGEALRLTPGPGDYEVQQTLNQTLKNSRNKSKAAFTTSQKKFNPVFSSYMQRVPTSSDLGPGCYQPEQASPMLKKSYNMALEGSRYI